MKNLTYILLTLFLISAFGIFAVGQTPTTLIHYYASEAQAPTTCVSTNRKHALIYIYNIGLKKCVNNVYVLAEGTGTGGSGGGTGTVTSVGLSLPSIFNIITSPITTNGTLSAALATQSGNVFFAGPSNGFGGIPNFRSIVAADIPALDAGKITTGTFASSLIPSLDAAKITSGIFPASRLGTNPTSTTFLRGDGTFATPAGGGTGGTGTVTSVGLFMPSIFNVTGSPITNTGTLTAALAVQNGNSIFAAPNGGTGLPTFRAMVSADIPALDAGKITTGVFPVSRLGTNPTNTTFLRGDGTFATPAGGGTGGGDAIIANGLGQFASTTSSALAGVLSNETGIGVSVFNNSPTILTPTIATILNGNSTINLPAKTGTAALVPIQVANQAALPSGANAATLGEAYQTLDTGKIFDVTGLNASNLPIYGERLVAGVSQVGTNSIVDGAITFGKIGNLPASTLMGRIPGSSGVTSAITLGENLSMSSTGVLSATTGTGGGGTGGGGTTPSSGLPAQIKVANDYTAADLGAKINAADLACNNNVANARIGCEIWVFDTGSVAGNTLETRVDLSSMHTLRFFPGTYYGGTAKTDPFAKSIIRMQDDTAIIGSSRENTILVEKDVPDSVVNGQAVNDGIMVVPYNAYFNCNVGNSATDSNCRASNLHISNMQFKGRPTNQGDTVGSSTISFNNVYNGSVTNCWFNGTSEWVFDVSSQNNSAPEYPDVTPGKTFVYNGIKMYAANGGNDIWFTDNLLTNIQTIMIGAISVTNYYVERNIIRNIGKEPFTITSVTNPNGGPIVVTTAEENNIFGSYNGTNNPIRSGYRLKLRNVTAANGAAAIPNTTEFYPEKINRFSFRLRSVNNTGTEAAPIFNYINGNGAGSYTVTADSKTDNLRGVTQVIDLETNNEFNKVSNVLIKDNLIDARVTHGLYVGGIAVQVTNASIADRGVQIIGNTMLPVLYGTGEFNTGIDMTGYPDGVIIADNYIEGVSGVGIAMRGNNLNVHNNTLINSGGTRSFVGDRLTNSVISNNSATGTVNGFGSFGEGGANTNNTWSNNVGRHHELFVDGGTGTSNSRYFNNTWIGPNNSGFRSVAGASNNLFQGNLTNPRLAGTSYGLELNSTTNRILSHSFTDGRHFTPGAITTAFNNPN